MHSAPHFYGTAWSTLWTQGHLQLQLTCMPQTDLKLVSELNVRASLKTCYSTCQRRQAWLTSLGTPELYYNLCCSVQVSANGLWPWMNASMANKHNNTGNCDPTRVSKAVTADGCAPRTAKTSTCRSNFSQTHMVKKHYLTHQMCPHKCKSRFRYFATSIDVFLN